MRKIHSLLVAACLLAASCNREEIQPETDKAGMYHITVAVTGTSPKGSVHIYNLDGVKFRNKRTGTSAFSVDETHGEIETYYPGFLLPQDTYYVGYIKGVGHIYQQTVIDTYSKIGFAKLYDRKNALVAADMLNDRVIPFFEQHDLKLMRMLTDRGTEYYGNRENHEYELYLAVEDIDHSKIKAKSPQTNGICERFNRTVQDEFYAIAFRKKIYTSIEQLQADLDTWMNSYNTQRTHSGKYCFGKTPTQTFIEGIAVARKYQLQNLEMMAHPINLGD